MPQLATPAARDAGLQDRAAPRTSEEWAPPQARVAAQSCRCQLVPKPVFFHLLRGLQHQVGGDALPDSAVRAGRRLRLILATALDDPNPNDAEWEGEMLSFAQCDTSVYSIPAGQQSEFMPECYKPLYGSSSTQ